MIKRTFSIAGLCLALVSFQALAEDEYDEAAYYAYQDAVWESLDKANGVINIEQAQAMLNVPEDFVFLASADARTVLEDLWGNYPNEDTLGMIVPAATNIFEDDAYAVVITYSDEGYVSDKEAKKLDYDEMLRDMQRDIAEASQQRVAAGYESIELIGWAAPPHYDAQNHKFYWAKELKFGSDDVHTLNYNIRVLGRSGVLQLNFVAGIEQLPQIEQDLEQVLAMAEFNPSQRYAAFNPDIDKVAAYGLGALVTGKVAAKTGLLAGLLIFAKKFFVLGLAALAGIARLFKRNKS